jgi:hypothetical protein
MLLGSSMRQNRVKAARFASKATSTQSTFNPYMAVKIKCTTCTRSMMPRPQ